MTPEKRIQNKILTYLYNLEKSGAPILVERRQAGGYNYKMGIPDVYCVVAGIHIEIEVKADNGELRPMQEKWKEKCDKIGIIYICAKSLDDVKSVILQFL